MQSHEDSSHRSEFIEKLYHRAQSMVGKQESVIAAGAPSEIPMARWKACGVYVQHLPDDPQGIARISIGGGEGLPVPLNYCSIRGTVGQCIDLLEKAIAALKACPE